MFTKLPLYLVLFFLSGLAHAESYRCQDAKGYFVYSGQPCASDGATEDTSARNASGSNSGARQNVSKNEDYAPVRSPDAATQACFEYVNTSARFLDPATTKLLSSSKKWVTVKDVGGRQMVTIKIVSKNEAGMYVGAETLKCLLMGDNVSINTDDYELVD